MTDTTVIMSFDLKKYRIRIHKSTIHLMGAPKYIHFLVNPEKRTVAIRAAEEGSHGKDAHRIRPQILELDHSYEIYSMAFLKKLIEVVGDLPTECSYRITGKLLPSQNMAVYSLDTITKIEG